MTFIYSYVISNHNNSVLYTDGKYSLDPWYHSEVNLVCHLTRFNVYKQCNLPLLPLFFVTTCPRRSKDHCKTSKCFKRMHVERAAISVPLV